VVGLELSF